MPTSKEMETPGNQTSLDGCSHPHEVFYQVTTMARLANSCSSKPAHARTGLISPHCNAHGTSIFELTSNDAKPACVSACV